MLTTAQKAFYDREGYLMVEDVVTGRDLARLQDVTRDLMERSRTVTASDDVYDLDAGHGPDAVRLTRIKLPHLRHPAFRDALWNGPLTQVLTDLLGPDTSLQTSKLNTKAPGGGAAVEWHQDWAFYPHTNDDMLAFGLMLDDVDAANGPLQVIPRSHRGPTLSHCSDGVFCGAVDPDDPEFHAERAVTLTGRAGSMTVHHARTLHGSAPNVSDRNRLILFYECRASDAWPLLGGSSLMGLASQAALWSEMSDRVVTGTLSTTPRMAAVPVSLPLPPPADASSIFALQRSGGVRSAF